MILNHDQLQNRARTYAMASDSLSHRGSSLPTWRTFQSDVHSLRQFAVLLSKGRASCTQPAEDWLLDHIDFIEKEAQTVVGQLPRRLLRQLPKHTVTGEPRIYSLCRDYLEQVDGQYQAQSFECYVNAYQEVSVLKIAECWALPSAMRVVLIRQLAERMREVRHRHEVCWMIESWFGGAPTRFDHGASTRSNDTSTRSADVIAILEKHMRGRVLTSTETVHLILHLGESGADLRGVWNWLASQGESRTEGMEQMVSIEHQLQSELQVGSGHLVQSLHQLERLPWHLMFGKISTVEQTLRDDCTHVYPRMDESSQNQVRHQIERLSLQLRVPETRLATSAVSLAVSAYTHWHKSQGEGDAPRTASIAYYLFDGQGRQELSNAMKHSQAVNPSHSRRRGFLRNTPRRTLQVYLLSILAILIIWLVLAARFIARGSGSVHHLSGWIAVGVAVLIPVSEWAMYSMHFLILRGCRPKGLLRYDFSAGVPAEARTMVVIPVLWSSIAEVDDIVHRLEVHYLANRQTNLHFAILADFPDAPSAAHELDESLVSRATKGVRALQAKYGIEKFYLFHRKRRLNPAEGTYMGWERKRGKLVELVELLSGSQTTSFSTVCGEVEWLSQIKYVLTVDADTKLPMGVVSRLTGTMHLPYNRPRLNAAGTRVVEGYGVLQPRIGVSYESTQSSRFASLFAGEPGMDVYSFATSDPYQDWFSEAIFVGKGLFDVEMFQKTLVERVPDNQILSHDLLEGGFLRAGLAADIEVVDEYPSTFYAYQQRAHRWIRGDWQLMTWLGRVCPARDGEKQRIDLCGLTKWQILDNLRRSLVAPVLLIVSWLGLTVLPGSPLRWWGLILLTIGFPFLQTVGANLTQGQVSRGLGYSFLQCVVRLLTLPYEAVVSLDAVLRTVYRVTVSRKNLLEWTPSAEVNRRGLNHRRFVLQPAAQAVVVLYVALAFCFGRGDTRIIALVLGFGWLWVAQLLIRRLNQPQSHASLPWNQPWLAKSRPMLEALAGDIWSFYATYVTSLESWLPPDNVQFHPKETIAHRTSPTNIGLYLACVMSAHDLGMIPLNEMLERLEATTLTLDGLGKWEGHLFNWYDTQTRAPLLPKYVSTVDSGNFVAYVMLVVQGLLKKLEEQLEWAVTLRIQQLAKHLNELVEATDFTALYDSDAALFTLGYHLDSHRHETILYDLLASEARQASFVGIALGQIPISHWFTLGRTLVKSGKHKTLLSWSGTMFEYLMPWLLLRTYPKTIWDSTYQGVLHRQRKYAAQKGVPFGISESGYYAFDYQLNYQYRAFGVPGLGFDRGHENNLVIAPYATILALPFAGEAGIDALQQLDRLGAKGVYGFYEAIDFTAARLPKGHRHEIIQSFMAHHQGMSLLTLANLLQAGRVIERFHTDPRVQAAELMLQERVPNRVALLENPLGFSTPKADIGPPQDLAERIYREQTRDVEVNVLSNRQMTSVTTNDGSGFLQWKGLAVTRWREDAVVDGFGPILYVHEVENNTLATPTRYPWAEGPMDCVFRLDKSCFQSRQNELEMRLDVTVASDVDAEVRCLTLTNTSLRNRTIEVTSFLELAMATVAADNAHPAFSKLFVQTSQAEECLLAQRRPREDASEEVWAAHTLYVDGQASGECEYETNREAFIGRGYSLTHPQALQSHLQGAVGSVADPAFIMRRRIRLGAKATVKVYAITGVAQTKEDVLGLMAGLREPAQAENAFQLAWVRTQIDLRQLHLSPSQAQAAHLLAARLLFTPPLNRQRSAAIAQNVLGQSALWSHGIGGDLPIVLVKLSNLADLAFVTLLLRQHQYLCGQGIETDLVILDETDGGYLEATIHQLRDMVAAQGIFEIRRMVGLKQSALSPAEVTLLYAVSRVVLRANGPSLSAQLHVDDNPVIETVPFKNSPVRVAPTGSVVPPALCPPSDGEFFNGWGRFVRDGRAYQMEVQPGYYLPKPWTNVLANAHFGCLVTELGTGYSWFRNSREFKLSPWSNDAVLDVPGECLYLKDINSQEVWSAAPKPAGGQRAYTTMHGHGYSQIEHNGKEITHVMETCVPLSDPVKLIRLRLTNEGNSVKQISLTYYVEWVLGTLRTSEAPFILTEWDAASQTLLARNTFQESFRAATGFLHIAIPSVGADSAQTARAAQVSYTGNRMEFLGRGGTVESPEGLQGATLSNNCGSFSNSCGALQTTVSLQPQETKDVLILLGCAESKREILELVQRYGQRDAYEEARSQVDSYWDNLLGRVTVSTPSRSMDVLLNGWLLYQTLACRMWARTAFYQAGGAFGFRDQLQDSLALLHADPSIPREQILRNAGHQYLEGDVQHWWHDETGKGIRTRFSDDLLWLPYAVSRYVEQTGEQQIFEEVVPFLTSDLLRTEEMERYEDTVVSADSGTVLDHCLRAIDHALRFGQHGIPLMGGGDWNDGMSRVGVEGRGESVWLGWFLLDILKRFLRFGEEAVGTKRMARYAQIVAELTAHLNENAWDGAWFRRAYTDAGTWLGSMEDVECRIDAIAQSWSVISEGTTGERQLRALRSFDRELVNRKLSVAKLLTPAFDKTQPSPGYIQGYPPGIRENGGQYTHGVIWSIMAWAMIGQSDKAYELFSLLNPIHHTATPREVATYAGEPYVMSADVYTASPLEGRAGWSWYTGAAGWMYQAGLEYILGVTRHTDRLFIRPCVPESWTEFSLVYHYGKTKYTLHVDCRASVAGHTAQDPQWTLDEGEVFTAESFLLVDDGIAHVVQVQVVPIQALSAQGVESVG